jgi:hypothetical protein
LPITDVPHHAIIAHKFAEDFIGASELEPPFWYTFVVLAEQEDGTFFWTCQQGGLGVATA